MLFNKPKKKKKHIIWNLLNKILLIENERYFSNLLRRKRKSFLEKIKVIKFRQKTIDQTLVHSPDYSLYYSSSYSTYYDSDYSQYYSLYYR